jgi:hypothetical protein
VDQSGRSIYAQLTAFVIGALTGAGIAAWRSAHSRPTVLAVSAIGTGA